MKINPYIYSYGLNFEGKKKTEKKQEQESKTITPDINSAEVVSVNQGYNVIRKLGKHATKIESAKFITSNENDTPISMNSDGSYTVNDETNTKVYFGKPAFELLENSEFNVDAQVIFPKDCSGVMYKDGKEIPLPEGSAIQITAGTKDVHIKIDDKCTGEKKQRSPFIITSERDFSWYGRHSKDAKQEFLVKKYNEMVECTANIYNAKFTPNLMLPRQFKDDKYLEEKLGIIKWKAGLALVDKIYENRDKIPNDNDKKEICFIKNITDKLVKTGLAEKHDDGCLSMKKLYAPDYQRKVLLDNKFSNEEIDRLLPILNQARQIKIDSMFARRNNAESYNPETINKMKQAGIFYDNKKNTQYVYWKEIYGTEKEVTDALIHAKDKQGNGIEFTEEEIEDILEAWKSENTSGYDLSGLKYIDKDLAIYNLNDKVNNWTQEETNWATNSTAISSTEKKSPSVGVSLVRFEPKKTIASMSELRMGEALHKHPNEENLKQYEVYFVTQGCAVLDVTKNGKRSEVVLNAGDMGIIQPSVEHCVNVVKGRYEHICAQVPSAFQYGFSMKKVMKDDEDKMSKFERGKSALEKEMAKAKSSGQKPSKVKKKSKK